MMVSKAGISELPGVDFQVNHVKLQGCNDESKMSDKW